MYLVKTPLLVQSLLKGLIWNMVDADTVFLTFDDGPIPEVTPWVLDQLKTYEAKATFFCVGENVVKYPHIYQRILEEGHSVGNHTFHHKNAWSTSSKMYLSDVCQAHKVIDSKLFRPPYGKINPSTLSNLKKEYNIIMWDVLSGDFDASITSNRCLQNVTSHAKKGSIIVFHDSIKASKHLQFVLPKVLEFFTVRGIKMTRIES